MECPFSSSVSQVLLTMITIEPLLRPWQYRHSRATDGQTYRNITVFIIIVEGDLQHTYIFYLLKGIKSCYDEGLEITHTHTQK